MPSDRKRVAAEIGQAVTLGLDDGWEQIAVELNRLRAKSATENSRSVLFELDVAAKLVADAIDRRFVKLLTLCQGYPARPDEVIEPVAEALRELIEQLRNYGGKRAAGAAPFGGTQPILVRSNEATDFAEKALEKARIDALQGYAGGRLVFPRSEWPPEDSAPVLAAAKPSRKPLKGMRLAVVEAAEELWGGPPPPALTPKAAENEITKHLRAKGRRVPSDVRRMLRHIKDDVWKSKT